MVAVLANKLPEITLWGFLYIKFKQNSAILLLQRFKISAIWVSLLFCFYSHRNCKSLALSWKLSVITVCNSMDWACYLYHVFYLCLTKNKKDIKCFFESSTIPIKDNCFNLYFHCWDYSAPRSDAVLSWYS